MRKNISKAVLSFLLGIAISTHIYAECEGDFDNVIKIESIPHPY